MAFEFHIAIHASAGRAPCAFDFSFETAIERLASLPTLFIEPDGSFVWATADSQMDGVLYDHQQRLHYIEAKGHCRVESMETFLRCLGWPDQQLVIQQMRAAVFLNAEEFLAQLEADGQ